MRLEIGHGRSSIASLTLHHTDCVSVRLNYDEVWLPVMLGVRTLGNGGQALKIEADGRELYRGTDGAFYVIKAMQADQITWGDLTLTRVAPSRCEEDL